MLIGGCLDDTLYTNRNCNRTLKQNERTFDVHLSDISLDDEPCYAGPSDRLKRAEDKEGVGKLHAGHDAFWFARDRTSLITAKVEYLVS